MATIAALKGLLSNPDIIKSVVPGVLGLLGLDFGGEASEDTGYDDDYEDEEDDKIDEVALEKKIRERIRQEERLRAKIIMEEQIRAKILDDMSNKGSTTASLGNRRRLAALNRSINNYRMRSAMVRENFLRRHRYIKPARRMARRNTREGFCPACMF